MPAPDVKQLLANAPWLQKMPTKLSDLGLLDPTSLANLLWQSRGMIDPGLTGKPGGVADLLAGAGRGFTNVVDRLTGGDVIPTYKEKQTDPSGFGADLYAERKGKVTNPELLRVQRALDKSERDVARLEGKPPPEQKAEPVDLSGTSWRPTGSVQAPTQVPRTDPSFSDIGRLLDPRPLGEALWSHRDLLNPIPLAQAVGRGTRAIGVDGANALMDMAGVPPHDPPRGGVQDWIDSALGLPPRPQTADEAREQQMQIARRGTAIDHAQAMKEIARESEPAESRPAFPPAVRSSEMPFNVITHSGPSFAPPGVTAQQPYTGINPLQAWLQMLRGAQQ